MAKAEKTAEDVRLASRDDFFSLAGLPYEDIPVPAFGEHVKARVKALDGLRGHLVSVAISDRGAAYTRAAYVAGCVVDENDKPVFTLEDVDRLAEMDWDLVLKLSDAAFRVCRLGRGRQEQTAENFERSQG